MIDLPAWLSEIHRELILPRRTALQNHTFMAQMKTGTAREEDASRFFSGLMWHLLDFGKHVSHLNQKRPLEIERLLEGRSEDTDGDTEILARIVKHFGGPAEQIAKSPSSYLPHHAWIHHDALLRAAIYSTDLPWQIGIAALNVGIESLVPDMIEPLFLASIQKYAVTSNEAAWLESRSGEAERQHGENGFLILSRFVPLSDTELQIRCRFWIDALSNSMAFGL
ncbi:MAG: hypothetical protein K2X47_17860, partial [Bdellovibrionales bacterium]|nr:hypothetical protein [Bdellovibrionales bacterium]